MRNRTRIEALLAETRGFARLAFRDNVETLRALPLAGRRGASLTTWLAEARSFYQNILNNAEFLIHMNDAGYERNELEAERTRSKRSPGATPNRNRAKVRPAPTPGLKRAAGGCV